jgi:hypothetical protein
MSKCFLSPPLSRLKENPRNSEVFELVEKHGLLKKKKPVTHHYSYHRKASEH